MERPIPAASAGGGNTATAQFGPNFKEIFTMTKAAVFIFIFGLLLTGFH